MVRSLLAEQQAAQAPVALGKAVNVCTTNALSRAAVGRRVLLPLALVRRARGSSRPSSPTPPPPNSPAWSAAALSPARSAAAQLPYAAPHPSPLRHTPLPRALPLSPAPRPAPLPCATLASRPRPVPAPDVAFAVVRVGTD
ncbi:alpha carbonic anhydrase 8-like [Sorghum bicolor]|uniref:alpha carbonic anhydrase 8-like n=1 Tax=Sorghum bicolor TaxID=4558 RepID=UPI000B4261A7|nr:alpha carbonic anhydrase 8-like [Sorghum bicolor]|eukprot:XP_021305543.1 alpha carbonic anhydrase 8-like [Sorghum bicolor]